MQFEKYLELDHVIKKCPLCDFDMGSNQVGFHDHETKEDLELHMGCLIRMMRIAIEKIRISDGKE